MSASNGSTKMKREVVRIAGSGTRGAGPNPDPFAEVRYSDESVVVAQDDGSGRLFPEE
jgi:hypothetical protein